MTSLAPVPSESYACKHCSAPLVADQRYCLSCGQPCSPVRLAFLDVLESDSPLQPGAAATATAPVVYTPYVEPPAGPAWLRRYAPLFAVFSVLLLAMIIGLLVGHWVTQSKAPSQQVIKVEGLSAAPLASAASTTPTTPTSTPAAKTSTASSSAKEEKEQEAEAKAEEKKPAAPPKPVKVSEGTLKKLTNSTGKKHQEEINNIGTAPIAVP